MLQLGCLVFHLVLLHVSSILILANKRYTQEPPNNITIGEFIWSSKHGRRPAATSRSPFTCGLTGKSFTVTQAPQRINFLARGLAQVLKVEPNKGLSLDKVIAIFSPNTVWISYGVDFKVPAIIIANQESWNNIDRLHTTNFGDSSNWRHCNSSKRISFAVWAWISAQKDWCYSHLHLRSAFEYCKEGCRAMWYYPRQDIHYGLPRGREHHVPYQPWETSLYWRKVTWSGGIELA